MKEALSICMFDHVDLTTIWREKVARQADGERIFERWEKEEKK